MYQQITMVERTVNLPRFTYANKNGIELIEETSFCENCNQLHENFILNFPSLGLWTWIEEDEFHRLVEDRGEEVTIEELFDLFQEGNPIHKHDLRFEITETDDGEKVRVSKKLEESFLQIEVDVSNFEYLDDLLNYMVEDFDTDFATGNYNSKTVEE